MDKLVNLVLVRHGKSIWNKENRFTGWTNVDLSDDGIKESIAISKKIKKMNIHFDYAFSSSLIRTKHTLRIVLDELNQNSIPIESTWRLNEKHYGALEGLDKDYCRKIYGEEAVLKWRRFPDATPPKLSRNDPRHPLNREDFKEFIDSGDLNEENCPSGESLNEALMRIEPFIKKTLLSLLRDEKNVLIVAHGNAIRGIAMYLEKIDANNIREFEIKTGNALCYTISANSLEIINKIILKP